MQKAIVDKNHVLKVAYTRLEARMHRLNIELCRDYAHIRFISILFIFMVQKEKNNDNNNIKIINNRCRYF